MSGDCIPGRETETGSSSILLIPCCSEWSLPRPPSRLRLLAVDLLLLPYGTALGIYALYVLLREDGKRLFIVNG